MADVKISALPTASVVNPADILVLNQGGTTKTAAKSLVVAGLATTSQLSGLVSTTQLSGYATTDQISGLTNSTQVQALTTEQLSAISINAGIGLSGGGDISANRTLQLAALTTEAVSMGSSSEVPTITVDTFGRIASTGVATITPASIGAFATNAIIAIENGGTGAFVPFDARTNLGAMAVDQQATGGDISGLLTAPNVTGLQGYAISPAAPNGGQILQYQNNNWEPVNYNPVPLDSPEFTGIPTAPTAAAQTNTTQIATTAFVLSNSGDRYLTTSTTSNTITNGSKTFTVASGLSYTPTQDITIVYDAANHMHGSVTSYSGTTLVVDIVQHSQTSPGPYTQWTINVGGLTNTAGTLLSANNLSDVANTATALTNIGGVPTSRTVSAGTGLTGGGDLTANRTLSIAALSPDPTGTYGSTSQIPSLTVNNLGQVTAASSLAMPTTNVQVFTSSATWSKPVGAKSVNVAMFGAGGGGASGTKNSAAATAKVGGGGGGGGGYLNVTVPATAFAATESVTVGLPGTGGAARIGDGAGGNNGSAGGFSQFGSLIAVGGGGGSGTGTAGTGIQMAHTGGSASGTGSAGAAGVPSITAAFLPGGPGGGGGGGITSAGTATAGGTGGRSNILNLAAGVGGGAGVAGGLGADAPPDYFAVGSAGGGGGASLVTNGANGGNGGFPAAGGGGGGATETGSQSGAGGNGGGGLVVITTYF